MIYLASGNKPRQGDSMNAFWQKIQRWSKAAGDFQARMLLAFLYIILVLPTGLIVKIGGDLLESRYPKQSTSFWKARNADDPSLRPARHQG